MNKNKTICSHCGAIIDSNDYEKFGGKIYCTDCLDDPQLIVIAVVQEFLLMMLMGMITQIFVLNATITTTQDVPAVMLCFAKMIPIILMVRHTVTIVTMMKEVKMI